MKRIKLYILLYVLGFGFTNYAQSVAFKELPIHISYYGDNGIHPGLKLGTSVEFWSKEKSKVYRLNFMNTKYGNKTKFRSLNVDYNLGFYSHANNHTGLFTNIGTSYLRVKERKGRVFGASFEIGYLRRFNKFETFELNSEGEIIENTLAGNNAILISLAPLFGKEFKLSNNKVRLFVKPILQMVKYNEKMQPNASLEIGMTFNINDK